MHLRSNFSQDYGYTWRQSRNHLPLSLAFMCRSHLLEGRKVTCAHNIICDVENAGADVQYGDDGTVGSVVDGDLITAKHPAFTDELLDLFLKEIESL